MNKNPLGGASPLGSSLSDSTDYIKHKENGLPIKKTNLLFENSWLDTKEAAVYLRTSPKQIRNWVYQGKIRAHRLLGRNYRFRREDLDSLLKGAF